MPEPSPFARESTSAMPMNQPTRVSRSWVKASTISPVERPIAQGRIAHSRPKRSMIQPPRKNREKSTTPATPITTDVVASSRPMLTAQTGSTT